MQVWYRQRVATWDATIPPPSREDDERAAKDHFQVKGLRELVRQVRTEEAPHDWTNDGPKGNKRYARNLVVQPGQK